jgi:hypothetical protein
MHPLSDFCEGSEVTGLTIRDEIFEDASAFLPLVA